MLIVRCTVVMALQTLEAIGDCVLAMGRGSFLGRIVARCSGGGSWGLTVTLETGGTEAPITFVVVTAGTLASVRIHSVMPSRIRVAARCDGAASGNIVATLTDALAISPLVRFQCCVLEEGLLGNFLVILPTSGRRPVHVSFDHVYVWCHGCGVGSIYIVFDMATVTVGTTNALTAAVMFMLAQVAVGTDIRAVEASVIGITIICFKEVAFRRHKATDHGGGEVVKGLAA